MKLTILNCIALMAFLAISIVSVAQDEKPRKSPRASTSQRIGVNTDIIINYSRPGVKGRTIWGGIVPYGLHEGNKYSNNKPYPWRAGADENTTIEFNNDVKINGKKITAGKYSIHMLPSEKSFDIMFNKKSDMWGSYTYNANENAVVITVTPIKAEHTEWLEFGFDELSDNGATAYMKWDKLQIPFKIELAK